MAILITLFIGLVVMTTLGIFLDWYCDYDRRHKSRVTVKHYNDNFKTTFRSWIGQNRKLLLILLFLYFAYWLFLIIVRFFNI